jgi:hypothetical protein
MHGNFFLVGEMCWEDDLHDICAKNNGADFLSMRIQTREVSIHWQCAYWERVRDRWERISFRVPVIQDELAFRTSRHTISASYLLDL